MQPHTHPILRLNSLVHTRTERLVKSGGSLEFGTCMPCPQCVCIHIPSLFKGGACLPGRKKTSLVMYLLDQASVFPECRNQVHFAYEQKRQKDRSKHRASLPLLLSQPPWDNFFSSFGNPLLTRAPDIVTSLPTLERRQFLNFHFSQNHFPELWPLMMPYCLRAPIRGALLGSHQDLKSQTPHGHSAQDCSWLVLIQWK